MNRNTRVWTVIGSLLLFAEGAAAQLHPPKSEPQRPIKTSLAVLRSAEMTAYRPQSKAYGDPLNRRAVSDRDEVSPGVGIRINGDDDDENSIPDRIDFAVPGENDLIEVELTIAQSPVLAGFEYVLSRSNANIKVWDSPNKTTAILDGNHESAIAFTASQRTVWVENPFGGSAFLHLNARNKVSGGVITGDTLRFYSFTTVVIALDGEGNVRVDPSLGLRSNGIPDITVALYTAGYDAFMYDEDFVSGNGSGVVYNDVVEAIQERGVTQVAIVGFSHGGGSTYDLAARLNANRASIGTFDIRYTAYIDGIENDSNFDLNSETRLPPTSAFHVNLYQSNFLSFPIWGDSVPGADIDLHVTLQPWGSSLTHSTMPLHSNVQALVVDPLMAMVSP